MPARIAVVLINTGTPDSYKVSDVRRYLRQFLGDERVINLPWLFRKILVNGVIAPIRGPRSAKLYREIWTEDGSPLLANSIKFTDALAKKLGPDYKIYLAMRYGNPSLNSCIADIATGSYEQIISVPLYPQYADSTTGTIQAEFTRLIRKFGITKPVKTIEPFFDTAEFIHAFASKIRQSRPEDYEHVIFSFHGLPVKQTEKMHPGLTCNEANCRYEYNQRNHKCYYASCYETARLLTAASGIREHSYSVSFQSRLGMNWLKPYTDEALKIKAAEGLKKALIVSPAFVADCLETIHELGVEYKHLFEASGGQQLTLVESLNDDDVWVGGMAKLITTLKETQTAD